MIRLEMKNYNMISTEKLPKYQLYHQAKLRSMNILLVKKSYHLINNKTQNKVNLIILLWEKCLKNKQKQLQTKEKDKEKQFRTKEKLIQLIYDNEDTPLISKQKELFNKFIDKRLEEITNLDQKVNSDDLIYRYKGNTVDVKFDEFAFSLLDKIRDGKISLADPKNDQAKFRSNLNEIKKETKNIDQKSKKMPCIILKCFAKQGRALLNFLMIILQ